MKRFLIGLITICALAEGWQIWRDHHPQPIRVEFECTGGPDCDN